MTLMTLEAEDDRTEPTLQDYTDRRSPELGCGDRSTTRHCPRMQGQILCARACRRRSSSRLASAA